MFSNRLDYIVDSFDKEFIINCHCNENVMSPRLLVIKRNSVTGYTDMGKSALEKNRDTDHTKIGKSTFEHNKDASHTKIDKGILRRNKDIGYSRINER